MSSPPQRVRLRRSKGWRKPAGAVVVSRPSKWGNPYALADYVADWPDASEAERRRMAVSDFRGLVDGRWEDGPDGPVAYPSRDEIVAELAGRDLCCWCPADEPCHADVLLELANGLEVQRQPVSAPT